MNQMLISLNASVSCIYNFKHSYSVAQLIHSCHYFVSPHTLAVVPNVGVEVDSQVTSADAYEVENDIYRVGHGYEFGIACITNSSFMAAWYIDNAKSNINCLLIYISPLLLRFKSIFYLCLQYQRLQ